MANHLIYHPRRERRTFDGEVVYFDRPSGNQDPYVWTDRFLHTFCHATELREPRIGDTNFWVSGDTFPDFTELLCDLVFTVGEVRIWPDRNSIETTNPIVDSPQAYQDHYRWAHQHPYKRRQRRTLKADSASSYQPQHIDHSLIDILPFLENVGIGQDILRMSMKKGFASQPVVIDEAIAAQLLNHIETQAAIRLTGARLQKIRLQHPELGSRMRGETA